MVSTARPPLSDSDNKLVDLLFSASLTIHGAVSLTSDRQTADLLRAAIDNLDRSVQRVRNLAFDQASPPVGEVVGAS
ncbi:hypothetical protein KGQ20_02805 [Catenulispora sp. NF23]|uniref:Uncharacterized protein n=1 Tax=Catenulispora pinistramenti TaxID=2705254 RepID=A0ABS5KM97_9ACTN|nr:hypothetical protein [Catenulispora pinistramenti]MBS2531695.1 hypothetical protein [Catenulispora pinistramenti]MBS2547134.1 hypothetical protein [Catenulispora pinistramenti]